MSLQLTRAENSALVENKMDDFLSILASLFSLAMICAWITHVIHCLLTAKYLLLIAGAFVFPVGIIHGIGIWFGVSW